VRRKMGFGVERNGACGGIRAESQSAADSGQGRGSRSVGERCDGDGGNAPGGLRWLSETATWVQAPGQPGCATGRVDRACTHTHTTPTLSVYSR